MIRALQLLFGLAAIIGGGAMLWFRPGAENGIFDITNKDGLWMAVAGLVIALFGLMLLLMGVSSRAKISKINRYKPTPAPAFPEPAAPRHDDEGDDAILRRKPAPEPDSESDGPGSAALAGAAGLTTAAGMAAAQAFSNRDEDLSGDQNNDILTQPPADDGDDTFAAAHSEGRPQFGADHVDSIEISDEAPIAATDPMDEVAQHMDDGLSESDLDAIAQEEDVVGATEDEPPLATATDETEPVASDETDPFTPAAEAYEAGDRDVYAATPMDDAATETEAAAADEATADIVQYDHSPEELSAAGLTAEAESAPAFGEASAELDVASEPLQDPTTVDTPAYDSEPDDAQIDVEAVTQEPLEEAYTSDFVTDVPDLADEAPSETQIETPASFETPELEPFSQPDLTRFEDAPAETAYADAPAEIQHDTSEASEELAQAEASPDPSSDEAAPEAVETLDAPGVETPFVGALTAETPDADIDGPDQTAAFVAPEYTAPYYLEPEVEPTAPIDTAPIDEVATSDADMAPAQDDTDGLGVEDAAAAAGAAIGAATLGAALSGEDPQEEPLYEDAAPQNEPAAFEAPVYDAPAYDPPAEYEASDDPATALDDAVAQVSQDLDAIAQEAAGVEESLTEAQSVEAVSELPEDSNQEPPAAETETVQGKPADDLSEAETVSFEPPHLEASLAGEAPLPSSYDATIAAQAADETEPPPSDDSQISVLVTDFPLLAPIREAIAEQDLEAADRHLARIRRDLIAQGDENTVELAALTALAGDHAEAAGRIGGAKWLWRLSIQRFQEARAGDSNWAKDVEARLSRIES